MSLMYVTRRVQSVASLLQMQQVTHIEGRLEECVGAQSGQLYCSAVRCRGSLAGNVMSERRYCSNLCVVEKGSGRTPEM